MGGGNNFKLCTQLFPGLCNCLEGERIVLDLIYIQQPFLCFGLGLSSELNKKILSWYLSLEHLQAVWLWQKTGVPFSSADLGIYVTFMV